MGAFDAARESTQANAEVQLAFQQVPLGRRHPQDGPVDDLPSNAPQHFAQLRRMKAVFQNAATCKAERLALHGATVS